MMPPVVKNVYDRILVSSKKFCVNLNIFHGNITENAYFYATYHKTIVLPQPNVAFVTITNSNVTENVRVCFSEHSVFRIV